MRTTEFIERALAFDCVDACGEIEMGNWRYISLKDKNQGLLAIVSTVSVGSLNTNYAVFDRLDNFTKKFLLELLFEYAKTPIRKRQEEEKYRLRHKLVKDVYLNDVYLNYVKDEKVLRFSTGDEIGRFKTFFTMREWEELTGRSWGALMTEFCKEGAEDGH